MYYRKLGRTRVAVSSLCLDTTMFDGVTAEMDSIRIIHSALDVSVNFIDTDNIYNRGESEVTVGRALLDHREHVDVGPRRLEQFEDYLAVLEIVFHREDEALVDSLVPPKEHSGRGFPDLSFPVTGRHLDG